MLQKTTSVLGAISAPSYPGMPALSAPKIFWTFCIIPYKTAPSQNFSTSFNPYEKLENKNDRIVSLMEKLHAKELEVMNIKMKVLMDRQQQLLDMNQLLMQGGNMSITQTKTLCLTQIEN